MIGMTAWWGGVMARLSALRLRLVVAVIAIVATSWAPASADQRVALVVGNSAYRNVPALPNPRNDADDVAAALGRLGFSVSKIEDGDFNSMRIALLDFGRRARGSDMAVIFFAGHGMEVGGENWLIPVDAELKSDLDVEGEAISLRAATLAVSSASKLGLVMLDACRNNPFSAKMQRSSRRRAVDRGLARVEPSGNVLVAYAAKDGTTADDGPDRNSPFTGALLRNLETPGLEVTFLFRNVHDDVIEATKGAQQPFIYGSLSKEAIYLKASPTRSEPRLDPVALARAKWAGWALTPQVGHALPVTAIALSPDGRRLATASLDMTIKLWDAATGRLLRTLVGHEAPPTSLQFAPDSRRLASGSLDTTIRLWDVATGQVLQTFTGTPVPVISVAFSPDGRLIVSGSGDSKISVWDVATGRVRQTIEGHGKPVLSVAFSRDRRRIISGSVDNTIKIWDAETFKLLRTLEGHTAPVLSIASSPDGRTIVSGSLDRTIRIWDVDTGKLLRVLGSHAGLVLSVAYSRDGQRIATGSLDGVIKLWDASTFRLIRAVKAHEGRPLAVAGMFSGWILGAVSGDFSGAATELISWVVSGGVPGAYALAFSLDSREVFSSGGDGSIKVWDVATGELARTLAGHSESVFSVGFSPDGRRIASAGFDGNVNLWDADNLRHVMTLEGHSGIVTTVGFSPDARRIASGNFDSTIQLWSVETGQLKGTIEGHLDAVTSVAFSPDGRKIVSGSLDKTVRVWSADTLQLLHTFEGHSMPVASVAFSPDGRRIISGSFDGTIRVWDVETGQSLASLNGQAHPIVSVAVSPNGRKIASVSVDDGKVRIWDADSGALLETLEAPKRASPHGLPDFLLSIAFSPDGRRLAAGASSRFLEVWDLEQAQSPRSLPGHLSLIPTVSFSPDGRRLASGGLFDKTVRLWDVETGRLLATSLSVGAGEHVTIDADGYFSASPGALAQLRLVRGLDSIELPDDYKAAFMHERSLDEIAAALR